MDPAELRTLVGNNIRRLAWAKGISLNRLADFAGVDRSGFIRALNAKAAFTTDRLAKIAQALDVPPSHLLEQAVEEMASSSASVAADTDTRDPQSPPKNDAPIDGENEQ